MKKIYFILSIAIALVFSMISCKKENNRITNSTYSIDSIEVFLDSIKQLSLIPGDLSVFDSIKQMNDTTAYYLFSNYYVDGNIHIDQIGGTMQKPRILVKDNRLVGLNFYRPNGSYGQDGSQYNRIKHYYSTTKLDSIKLESFSFYNTIYDENLFFNTTAYPDSLSGIPDKNIYKSTILYTYNQNNLHTIEYLFESQNTISDLQYSNIENQTNLIGIDVNTLILGSFYNPIYSIAYGGSNGNFLFQLMYLNTKINLGMPESDNLLLIIDNPIINPVAVEINYDFDSTKNNRIKSIDFPFYTASQKLIYIFHYKN